jgi:CRP-like cAMP-binding protein/RsiW-degrading membrane proteinase PrsW (M82 family)
VASLTFIIILAVLPIPIIYVFYHRYFIVKPSYLHHLEYFIYGAILALVIVLFKQHAGQAAALQGDIARGFLHAALAEKTSAFILILFLMYASRHVLMVLNSVISAMLLGMGFATVENILYALDIRTSVVIVRLISSVPLHVLTCGMIGYYLALMRLSGSRMNKAVYAFNALVFPLLFHGAYDTLLFVGGYATYWIAPLLVVLILWMEYMLARSQNLPLQDGLTKHHLFLEDWAAMQRQPQYERWILRSMGSKSTKRVPLIRLGLGPFKIGFISIMLVASLASVPAAGVVLSAFGYGLKTEEYYMLFTLLPALYSLNLFIIGMVNPKYFQNSIIRIPIIIDVDMETNGAAGRTITYHLTHRNCHLKTAESLGPGTRCLLRFECQNFSSPGVPGSVIWDAHDEQTQISGTLVRFSRRPRGFLVFLIKYNLYRLMKGLSFNLRLPGSKSTRQLFVRPASVMQHEQRISAGRTLFKQGDEATAFYLIKKGEVDIIKTLETGERVVMATLTQGDIFGEMAIAGGQPRLATAICRTDCVLAVAETGNLEALIEMNPSFAQRLIRSFANRLNASERIMLGNIADSERASKEREEKIRAVCRIILAFSKLKKTNPVLTDSDIERISEKLNMDAGKIRELAALLSEINDDEPPDAVIDSCLERL